MTKLVKYVGNIVLGIIIINNKKLTHNKYGCSWVSYDDYGNIMTIYYDVNGVLHNLKGPAEKRYYANKLTSYLYYINGKYNEKILNNKQLKKYLKLLNIN